ncbi:Thiosulfate sulfurtransferase/rhodanese-like domain-containing protein 3 [Clonorchis sinensis]|uniref:Thiosulfate sulfurtransferase/rhodanese-like domain-containing protein 3 n=1 Tax=Clonorchis sinensis TaxID=79923 RepID=A0A8T1MDX2_CLOSI|nr:Thiosulfate sulfurtransferase/rhodanese-like domain-containing protein 3 [Clonorchis sinensis]
MSARATYFLRGFARPFVRGSSGQCVRASYSYRECAASIHCSVKSGRVTRVFSTVAGKPAKKAGFPEALCGKRSINYNELASLLTEYSVVLIDVRDPTDFLEVGHIPGAINIPLADLKSALKLTDEAFHAKYGIEKPKYTDENIVFYGLSDVLSTAASEIAHGLGYKKSKFYPEGWTGWSTMLP